MKKLLFLLLISISSLCAGQETYIYNDINEQLFTANALFDIKEYALSSKVYEEIIQEYNAHPQINSHDIIGKAEIGYARCQKKMNTPQSPKTLHKTINKYHPHNYTTPAVLEMANFFYNNKEYEQALKMYEKVTNANLHRTKRNELEFKMGYCNFIQKNFDTAIEHFDNGLQHNNKYQSQNQYYKGMAAYFNDDHETALKMFNKIEGKKQYKSHIPLYISQIYFSKQEYNKLTKYVEKQLKKSNIKNKEELSLLLGQTYFIKGNYNKALPHLQYYESHTDKLSEDEFYQLGYTQYSLNQYEDAIDNFIELTMLDNKMGLLSNYYLADCYMKVNDKTSARTAFKKVSKMDLAEEIKDEAAFNYAKLSAETGFEREALSELLALSSHPQFGHESQTIISQLLLHTADYSNAISTINSIPNRSSELDNTLSNLMFNLALQQYNDKKYDQAYNSFENVLKSAYNSGQLSQALYYKAMIDHKRDNYDSSINTLQKYTAATTSNSSLPDESSIPMAQYLQGTNYLNINKYKEALAAFELGLDNINRINNQQIATTLKSELIIRSSDCAFKTHKKNKAEQYYTKSIALQDKNTTYATFQKAIINGLNNKPYDKIVLLENITDQPNNSWTDDALLQLGNTYLSLSKTNKAFSNYKKIIKKHKDSPYRNQALIQLGILSYNQGDVQDALGFYKEVFVNNPSPRESKQALLSIQEIYIDDLGDADEFIKFSEDIAGTEISSFSKDSLFYNIAYTQYKYGKYSQGIEKFDRYLKKYPKGYYIIPAQYYKAESQTLIKSYADALLSYEAVIGHGPSEYYNKSIRKAAIINYNHSLNFEKALKYYQLMAQLSDDPEQKYEAQLGILWAANKLNNYTVVLSNASKVINHKLVTKEDKTTALFVQAKANYKTRNFEEAIPLLNKIVRATNNEQTAESKYMLAQIFYQKKLYDKAQKQCMDINNSNNYPFWVAKSLILLADVLSQQSDYFNAKAALEAVIEHYQDNPDILKEASDKLIIIKQKEVDNSRLKESSGEAVEMD